jgi:histidine ammonia-lyase
MSRAEDAVRTMTRPASWNLIRLEMSRLIAEIELLSSAQAGRVVALTRSGNDTEEARERLWQQMDALFALRREHAAIEGLTQIKS